MGSEMCIRDRFQLAGKVVRHPVKNRRNIGRRIRRRSRGVDRQKPHAGYHPRPSHQWIVVTTGRNLFAVRSKSIEVDGQVSKLAVPKRPRCTSDPVYDRHRIQKSERRVWKNQPAVGQLNLVR